MEKNEYIKMAQQESAYWWYIGRKAIVKKQLKIIAQELNSKDLKILNVGSGTGGTIPLLEQFGTVLNADVSQQALDILKEKGIKNLHKIDGKMLPFKNNEFDLVVAMDVLEHIEDDLDALMEWSRVLKKDGRLLITVPAYQWLWSEHDESLHHFRRYTASGLHKLVNQAYFKVRKRSYMITFTFPLVVSYRLISSIFRKPTSKNKKETSHVAVPSPINKLFILLLKIEASLLTRIGLPFGTSILLVSRNDKK